MILRFPLSCLFRKGFSHPILSSQVNTSLFKHVDPPVSRMFSQQAQLPRLPVPQLQQTLQKYLRYVEPLVTSEQFNNTQKLVHKFGESNGEGDKLQSLLMKRAEETENWLAEYWLEVAYLAYRAPVVINSNPGIILPSQNYANEDEWLAYVAKFIHGTISFKKTIDSQTLEVEQMGKDPLCMMQYYSILASCRIPQSGMDSLVCYRADTEEGFAVRHICVMHNNRIFRLEVMSDSHEPLHEQDIYTQLKTVVTNSSTKGIPIGIMTTENRDTWADVYSLISKDDTNAQSLEIINKSIFFVCLDGIISNNSLARAAENMLHGLGPKANSSNRWFDKTLQFIFSRDGSCGLNYEHSPAEGPPVVTLLNYTLDYIANNPQLHADNSQSKYIDSVAELQFNLTDPQITDAINSAAQKHQKSVENVELEVFRFTDFGKDFPKRNKMSPDAFFQIALQLAYYRMYGKPCATYESGSIRRFSLGRTDTIRSCSKESLQFCLSMQDQSLSETTQLDSLIAAISRHKNYTQEVMNGQGIDRHLLGLKLMAIKNDYPIPALYTDPTYSKSQHYNLSTSQVASPNELLLCFGPVVDDGYGICYNPQENQFLYCVSSYISNSSTNARNLGQHVEKALLDMKELVANHLSSFNESPKPKL